MIRKIVLILFICIVSLQAVSKSVYVKNEKDNSHINTYIVNNSLYDITVQYNAEVNNLITTDILPIQKIVKAKSKKRITGYYISSGKYSLKSNISFTFGSKYSVHDDTYLYRLPYQLKTYQQVTQGFNGYFSHKGNSLYAVDFGLKVGTKIYASRGGIVVDTKNNGYLHGDKNFIAHANFITIRHDDGTYAKYVHLKKGGVKVKVGQKVKRGEFIGYSGNTGYTNGPHLHFVVFKGKTYNSRESLRIKFISANGVVNNPIRGLKYRAVKLPSKRRDYYAQSYE